MTAVIFFPFGFLIYIRYYIYILSMLSLLAYNDVVWLFPHVYIRENRGGDFGHSQLGFMNPAGHCRY